MRSGEPRTSRLALPILAFAVVASASLPSSPSSISSTLRIEAIGPPRLQVALTSTPAGLFLDSARADDVQHKLVVVTPRAVFVADSVRTLRVVVQGMAAVRLQFNSLPTHLQPAVPIWGRDVTLVRQPDGRFDPVVRAHRVP
jgi:hypothetical protein